MKELTVKRFLEEHQGWKAVSASVQGSSVKYLYTKGKQSLTVEQKPDHSYSLTYNGETRIVPNKEACSAALGHKEPSDLDVIRIFSQVLDKMLRKNREETHAAVVDQMERHSRQQF